jgi:hypothetical protein
MNWKVRSRRAERTRWAVRVCETSRQEVEATVESGIVEKRGGGGAGRCREQVCAV